MTDIETIHAHLARGDAWQAEAMAREGLQSSDDAAPWLCALGLSLAQQARAHEAGDVFRQLAALQPAEPAHWVNIGNACLHQGLAHEALSAFERAQRLGAAGIEFELGYGLALLAAGHHAQATRTLRIAHAADRTAADTCIAYAVSLCELEQHDEALAVLDGMRRPVQLSRRHAEMQAWILVQAGRDHEAEALLRELIDADPGEPTQRIQLALLLERLNRLPEAGNELAHASVRQAPPGVALGLASARVLRRNGDHAGALRALDAGEAASSDDAGRAALAFERTKALDASGDYDRAIETLAHAHAYAGYALETRFPDLAAGHELAWLDERLERPAPSSWREPINDDLPADPAFLVGFPRSGTTLLETVLNSHPGIVALDERPALEAAVARLKSAPVDAGDALLLAPDALRRDARRTYWSEVVRYRADARDGLLLDKYPLHLSRAPYVARLFPGARMLLLLRHPCDCVLSCYMQSFGMNGGVLSFATLEATAETYARIMGYWEQQRMLVATPVHSLRYEDLVDDFEGETVRALDFLGLPWDPSVAGYRQAAATRANRIRTPSYAQVVAPLNRGAVDRWLRYRKHFSARTLELLAPFVERYGYSLD